MFAILVAVAAGCQAVGGSDVVPGAESLGRQADWYYPREEPGERTALQVPSFAGTAGADVLLAAADGKQRGRFRVGGDFAGWRIAEMLSSPEPIVVLEREAAHWGLIVFLGKRGVVAEVRKAIGRLEAIREPQVDFPKDYFERLLAAKADVLAQKVLASREEPSYEAVAGFLAPLTSYTFLGSPSSPVKYVVQPDGSIGVLPSRGGGNKPLEKVLFDPKTVLPPGVSTGQPAVAKRGLLGGHLPAIDYGFVERKGGPAWELCALMEKGDSGSVHVRVRRTDGQTAFYRLPPLEKVSDGKAFFAALLELQQSWQRFLAGGMQLETTDRRAVDASRAAICRAMSGCVGLHPKYGMGAYWGASDLHDGFPPTTLSLCTCLLDWGFTQEAGQRLGYYLDRFVRPDGTLKYYGPAVAEYGELLDLAAACAQRTGDWRWFDEHRPAILRIVDYLLRLRTQSKQSQPRGAITYGLLFGGAEADTHEQREYYFSNSVWCWRGLLEIGKLCLKAGTQRQDAALAARGREILDECKALHADVRRAVDRSVISSGGGDFVPPIAGFGKPFATMTQDQLASYTNYRYWLEALSAGCLAAEKEQAIIAYRLAHGGELLGMTRFEDHLDDWPYYHYASSILAHDRIAHYLLGYYAHMAHHQTPGTLTAYEQVPIRGQPFRSESADYCVPSQLTIPLMTRWMLASEERDADVLWLCRAVPRAWLSGRLSFSKAATRWGPVDLELRPESDLRRMTARIVLPKQAKPTLMLRIPHPARMRITDCQAQGARCEEVDAGRELIRLKPEGGTITVTLTFGP
jgi:hypothetical protein